MDITGEAGNSSLVYQKHKTSHYETSSTGCFQDHVYPHMKDALFSKDTDRYRPVLSRDETQCKHLPYF